NRGIALTADGSRAVVRTSEGLQIVSVNQAAEPSTIAAPALADFAIVGSELWIVDQLERLTLRRFTLRGELVGSPQPLGNATGRLVVAGSNSCAAWTGAPPTLIDATTGSRHALPGEPEFAL